MSTNKTRLTITVDPELVAAGNRAVANGTAHSISAWVNEAMAERAHHDQLLARLGEAIATYEMEFGEISEDEIEKQTRADRSSARVVRGPRKPAKRRLA
jgi:hypothetical protein